MSYKVSNGKMHWQDSAVIVVMNICESGPDIDITYFVQELNKSCCKIWCPSSIRPKGLFKPFAAAGVVQLDCNRKQIAFFET